MELTEVLEWIDRQLEAKGLSDLAAEKASRCPSLIQNIRKTIKNGHGSLPKPANLAKLAKVLGDPPPRLLEPLAPLRANADNESPAVKTLRAEQAEYLQKANGAREAFEEYQRMADALELSIAVLKRKKAG